MAKREGLLVVDMMMSTVVRRYNPKFLAADEELALRNGGGIGWPDNIYIIIYIVLRRWLVRAEYNI